MGCLDVKYLRVGGGIDASFSRAGCFFAGFSRESSGLNCTFSLVCDTNLRPPFLEIYPEIVWVLDGWASNDVYSNTQWNVG